MRKLLLLSVVFLSCARSEQGPSATAPRIRTEGSMSVKVTDLFTAEEKLGELIAARGGTVASTQNEGHSATWTVRVPSDRFRETIAAVAGLGRVTVISTQATDVTGEYYDSDARLGAKVMEESRLLRILDTSAANLADVLAVEKELSRVRGEIEELTVRKKVLERTTATSALSVMMNEESAFILPRLGATVTGSFEALVTTVQMGVVVLAALLPWLLFGAMLVLPVSVLVRRQRARGPA